MDTLLSIPAKSLAGPTRATLETEADQANHEMIVFKLMMKRKELRGWVLRY
jgi:hypothetical protein